MRTYESIFITAPTVGPEQYDRLVETFTEVINDNGGNLVNTTKWGRRTLAYEIKKFREGIYTIFEFEGSGELVKELERRFKLNDSVIKFMTVKTERQKKLVQKGTAKRKAKQDAKAKRRAAKGKSDSREERRV